MKLNEHFIKHTIDGQTVLVPLEGAPFHGLVRGNKSVEVILDCLQTETTEQEIIDAMCQCFSGDRVLIEADVADVLKRLKEIGAIDE